MRGRTSRAVGFISLAIVVALLVAACGGGSEDTGESQTNTSASESSSSGEGGAASTGATSGATIGFSIPQGTDPALQLLDEGMSKEAEKLGMKVQTTDANLDVNKQISDLETFIQQKVNAIVVWPLDGHAVIPVLERASAANIPIITIYDLAPGPYTSDIIIDGKGVGRSGAEFFAKELGKGAKVAAVFGPPQVDQFRQIAEGFKEGAEETGIDLVESQVDMQISSQTTSPLVQNFEVRYGSELEGVFTSTDTMANGAFSVLGGSFKPMIVTYGSLPETLEMVSSGQYGAVVLQESTLLGRIAAWAAAQALEGNKIPKRLYTEPPVIGKEAAAKFPSTEEQLTMPYKFEPVQKEGRYVMPMFGG